MLFSWEEVVSGEVYCLKKGLSYRGDWEDDSHCSGVWVVWHIVKTEFFLSG